MTSFIDTLIPLVTVVSIGALLRLGTGIDPRILARASFYVFTPCLVFQKILETELAADDVLRIVAVAVSLSVVMGVTGLGLGRLLRWQDDHRSAVLLVLLFMNGGNFGLSFNELHYGAVGLQVASIWFIVNVVLLNTLGVYIAARGAHDAREAAVRLFRFPLIYAVPLALVFRLIGIPWDAPALGGINLLAKGTVPLLLIILGVKLASIRGGHHYKPALLPSCLRLFFSPLVAYGFGRLVGLEGLPLTVVTVQAAMPSAINNLVLALQFDTRPKLVGAMILVTTLASLVTLWVVVTLLGPPI
jgi:predicted permease